MSTASPEILVDVCEDGFGMAPALELLRYSVKLRNVAVASSIGSHSRTMEVCVALRTLRTGFCGELMP